MSIKFFNERLKLSSDRTKNITRHIGMSLFYKLGSILSNFLLVPVILNYLDFSNYGIWLTISSFMTWFSFFDVGLGNGLRNKIAEANVNNNSREIKEFVSTAYFSIGLISSFLVLLFCSINNYIDWTVVFNADQNLRTELNILLPVVFTFFCIRLVLNLIVNIYQGMQSHSISEKIQFFGNFFSLILLWSLTKVSHGSILYFGIGYSAIPVLILIIFNLVAFNGKYKNYKPKFNKFSLEKLKSVTGLGFNFFITKIGALMLLTTDSFIISHLFSPDYVVTYQIAFKYFSVVTIIYSVVITPYWSSFTDAYFNNDIKWIKKAIRSIQVIWFLIPLTLVLMLIFSNFFYELWVGSEVIVPFSLSLSIALYVLIYTFNQIYNQFINGVGKIKLHVFISLVIILLNIPLSIFFVRSMDMGLYGVVLSSCSCLLLKSLFLPVQYYKIINKKASGIWNV